MNHHPIIALAPNGAHRQKEEHPALPLSPEEIVLTAIDAMQAGASLLHLHVRDENGQHTLDASTYLRTIDSIRTHTGDRLIIQITSEAAGMYTPAQQIDCIQAVKPESASIALRELVPEPSYLPAAQSLFHWCAEQQCRAQFILYSEADLQAYLEYRESGVIPSAPHSLLFVLGHYARDEGSRPEDLSPFLQYIDAIEIPWMVCAFGSQEQAVLLEAARRKGHMRTGFENNLLTPDGAPARDNIEQIERLLKASTEAGLRPASITEARQLLHL